MPLTFSIANGIAFGFITHGAAKLIATHWREANPSVLVLAAIFIVKYVAFWKKARDRSRQAA
jgi:AGZA family xanthine/uracil permease-like MFS transporter